MVLVVTVVVSVSQLPYELLNYFQLEMIRCCFIEYLSEPRETKP